MQYVFGGIAAIWYLARNCYLPDAYFEGDVTTKNNEKKKEVVKSSVWLQNDGSVYVYKAENWHDCTPLSIPDELAGNVTVMTRDLETGKREFRICVFNIGRRHIPFKEFQEKHISAIQNWVATGTYWTEAQRCAISLDFYTGTARDYYAKNDNVKLKLSKKIK